jgi:hypothetical protein
MGGFGDILSAGSGIASMFGGDEETGSPSSSQSSSISGYFALPPQAQAAYDRYFDMVNNLLGGSAPNATSFRKVNAPLSPFDSAELFALQAANPDQGVLPTGVTEPFNQFQKTALTFLGNPDFSTQGLQQFMNPFNDQVLNTTLNSINRQSGINRSNILDNNSRLNARALGSGLSTQLSQNDDATNRLVAETAANLGFKGFNSALDLRDKSLQQILGAGSAIQEQNQNILNSTNPVTRFQLDPQFLKTSLLAPLFGAFPQSSQSTSSAVGSTITDNSRQATNTARLGGLGTAIYGSNGLSNIFG